MAEIRSPDFPGERLLVCLNPRLQVERARKREELLRATEHILEGIRRPGAAWAGAVARAGTRSTAAWAAS